MLGPMAILGAKVEERDHDAIRSRRQSSTGWPRIAERPRRGGEQFDDAQAALAVGERAGAGLDAVGELLASR